MDPPEKVQEREPADRSRMMTGGECCGEPVGFVAVEIDELASGFTGEGVVQVQANPVAVGADVHAGAVAVMDPKQRNGKMGQWWVIHADPPASAERRGVVVHARSALERLASGVQTEVMRPTRARAT
ncbi:hypothetical protein ACFWM1_26285 [Nocardia sp. NPDC058379]|uniref:hypothetical protein n=1 Tax=unclassified Nocardia TaxID=2637762 RepID=UPI00365DE1CA